jgi:Sec-independent protein translocase protein TatA
LAGLGGGLGRSIREFRQALRPDEDKPALREPDHRPNPELPQATGDAANASQRLDSAPADHPANPGSTSEQPQAAQAGIGTETVAAEREKVD